jgi:Flp pilus assembly pilin Flp
MLTSAYTNTIWLRNRIVEKMRIHAADQRGAALVEYAFLLSFIVMVCVAAITLLGANNNASANRSATSIINAN